MPASPGPPYWSPYRKPERYIPVCPYCAAEVKPEALACPRCKREFAVQVVKK